MMKKVSRDENPLKQPPLEHFQPIEEDIEDDQDEEKREEGVMGRVIPPLRHPYPPFWEEENSEL
jgi:hypothetical protein